MAGQRSSRQSSSPDWWIYRGTGELVDPVERDRRWPAPPRWRAFDGGPDEPVPPREDPDLERWLGTAVVSDHVDEDEANLVNAAIYLRRPLLVTGSPGAAKSRLAYQIARELQLGPVLRWTITTQTTVRSGLYEYDAVGRAYAAGQRPADPSAEPAVGEFIHLGPLGTALLPYRLPRVLLIEELEQSDIDLPHQLGTVLRDGGFEIRELIRARARTPEVMVNTADPGGTATIRSGRVRCHEFPIVVMMCDEARELPSALWQHCLQLRVTEPDETRLTELISAHFPEGADGAGEVLRAYLDQRERVDGLGADRLLDAVHLRATGAFSAIDRAAWDRLIGAIWQPVSPADP